MACPFCWFLELSVKRGCGGNTSPAQLQSSPDSVVACAKPCLMRWHKARSEGQCQQAAQAGLNQNSCSFSTSEFPHLLPDSVECVLWKHWHHLLPSSSAPCSTGDCPTSRWSHPTAPIACWIPLPVGAGQPLDPEQGVCSKVAWGGRAQAGTCGLRAREQSLLRSAV